jgi:hypothetical protein
MLWGTPEKKSAIMAKGGRPFIECIQWRDSPLYDGFNSLGIRLKRGMTWPEWSRERLISLAFAGIYFRDGRSCRNILSYTGSRLDAPEGIRFQLLSCLTFQY